MDRGHSYYEYTIQVADVLYEPLDTYKDSLLKASCNAKLVSENGWRDLKEGCLVVLNVAELKHTLPHTPCFHVWPEF